MGDRLTIGLVAVMTSRTGTADIAVIHGHRQPGVIAMAQRTIFPGEDMRGKLARGIRAVMAGTTTLLDILVRKAGR